jgi:hypothetical protein
MEVEMNDEIRGAVIGMVYGDGYVNTTGGKHELVVTHSLTQADYCEHKAARLRKYFGRDFKLCKYKNGPGGKYWCLKFACSHPYMTQVRSWTYPGGKKYFLKRTLEMLTPEGLAFWYMDDGSCHRNIDPKGWTTSVSSTIATFCSLIEAETIVEYFRREHQIEFKIRCKKSAPESHRFYLEANTEQSRWFVRLIQPYVIPSMLYKIAHVADLTAHEPRAPVGRCAECQKEIFGSQFGGLCAACYSRKYYRETRKFRDMKSRTGDDIVRPAEKIESVETVDKEPQC